MNSLNTGLNRRSYWLKEKNKYKTLIYLGVFLIMSEIEETREVKMPVYEAFQESMHEAWNVKEKFEVLLWLRPEEEREQARKEMRPELVAAIKANPEYYKWAEEILAAETVE